MFLFCSKDVKRIKTGDAAGSTTRSQRRMAAEPSRPPATRKL
jgi:hypothetical protein